MARNLDGSVEAQNKDSKHAPGLSLYAHQMMVADHGGNSAPTNASNMDVPAGGVLHIPALQYTNRNSSDNSASGAQTAQPAPDAATRLSLEYELAAKSEDPKDIQRFKNDLTDSLRKDSLSAGTALIDRIDDQLPANLRIDASPVANTEVLGGVVKLDFVQGGGTLGKFDEVTSPMQVAFPKQFIIDR